MPFGVNDTVVATGGFGGARDAVLGNTPIGPRQAQDVGDAIISGLQNSATGLLARGKMPDTALGEDSPWYHRAAAGAAGVIADLPLSVVGAVPGAAAGSAAGSAVPVVGTAAGAVVGGAAGAFAAPMALRDGLIELYNQQGKVMNDAIKRKQDKEWRATL